MKNQQLITSIILILVVIGGIILLSRNNHKDVTPTPPPTEEADKPEPAINQALVDEETYTTPDQYATFDVTYPQFSNVSPLFNSKIKNVVMDAIDQQKTDSAANWQARFKTQFKGEGVKEFPSNEEKFTLVISWTPVQVNSKYISFILTIGGYTGGAHGFENIVSFNYDVKAKKEITLKNLFPNDPNYLQTLSTLSRKDLEKQFRQRLEVKTKDDEANFKESIIPMLNEGTTPNAENFSVFTFTPSTVTLYFTEYQVAPYAMGSSTVNITR